MKRLPSLSILLLSALLGACKDSPTEPPDPFGEPRKYAVGDQVTFNVNAKENCQNPVERTGRVVAVTERAVVVADVGNPAEGFTDADYLFFGREFDRLVWPTVTRSFGEPGDVDKNGRAVIFFTRAVNDLTPAGANYYIGGFFFARDLFPKTAGGGFGACATSNVAEMFYMRVPEPGKENFSRADVERTTVGVLGHEFQHLINASRRLFVVKATGENWDEEVWLNEGLSHVAEEMLFYAESGLSPRQNVGYQTLTSSNQVRIAANTYQLSNFGRLDRYLAAPEGNSPYGDGDALPTRGAIWQFLRFAADQRGGDETAMWRGLVDSKETGMANLRKVLGADVASVFRSWSVAVYTDDAVPGTEARFTHPSWDYRTALAAIRKDKSFPLRTHHLANASPKQLSLQAGGSAYLRFGVAPATRAELRVTGADTAAAPSSCQGVTLQPGQVHSAPAAAATLLCMDGGATGAEFTAVLFYGAEGTGTLASVSATATGIVPVLGGPSPDRAPLPAPSLSLAAAPGAHQDLGFEARLRQRERELSALVPGGGIPSPRMSRSAAAGPEKLMVSIVRTN